MPPTSATLRRLLTAALVILPPLAGTDLCTVGALTGRAELMCGMERTATACPARPVLLACPHCAPAGAAPASAPAPAPASHGPTCCDLRPQAAGPGEAPTLAAPLTAVHLAVAAPDPAGIPPAPAVACVEPGAGRAPPGRSALPLSARAPPLG
jgi:hypothetical protein